MAPLKFCPECSNLLRKKTYGDQIVLECKCGYQEEITKDKAEIQKKIQKKKKALEKNIIVVSSEDKISVHPKIKKVCPKCKHKEAEYWQEQTRSADEASTSFFRCTKCKYTWREY
ncbi:MAG: transcription factor S [Promethearchaeota archaeon]|nr:MAG: transcription factor S [Candidatus Lokiarchaeota archaeon]